MTPNTSEDMVVGDSYDCPVTQENSIFSGQLNLTCTTNHSCEYRLFPWVTHLTSQLSPHTFELEVTGILKLAKHHYDSKQLVEFDRL